MSAAECANIGEATLTNVFERLRKRWNVESEDLFRQFPIIISIITGKPQTSETAYTKLKLHSRNVAIMRNIPNEVKTKGIEKLRIGKHADYLLKHNIKTVNDVLLLAEEVMPTPVGKTLKHLENFIGSPVNNRDSMWEFHRDALGLGILPLHPCSNIEDFLPNLTDDLGTLLKLAKPAVRAAEIFRIRTSKPSSERPSLDEAGKKLGTYGPDVKHAETKFLRFLNNLIIRKKFCCWQTRLNHL